MRTTAKERFDQMLKRCSALLEFQCKPDIQEDIREDILRSVVVYLVSALDAYASDRFMENFTRHIQSHKLSKVEVELLEKSGVTVAVALELMSKRTKRPYGKIRTYVENHFSKMSMQSFNSINSLYKYLGLEHIVEDAIKKADRKTLPVKINAMLKRRHSIVHEGDYDGNHKLRTINFTDVNKWFNATSMLVESMDSIVEQCVNNNCKKNISRNKKSRLK